MNGVIIIVKTEVYDGVCIINIKTKDDIFSCSDLIKQEFKVRGIEILFCSSADFGKNKKSIIIASFENDIFKILSSIGYIKDAAGILSYTIRGASCIIFWEGFFNGDAVFKKYKNKISYCSSGSKSGCVLCESEIKHKLLAAMK